MVDALMALAPGYRLGPYEIVAAIGAGGMGEVCRARDTNLQRDVAVKILPAVEQKSLERSAANRHGMLTFLPAALPIGR